MKAARALVLVAAFLCLGFFAVDVMAQVPSASSGNVGTLVTRFRDGFAPMQAALLGAAISLFWVLAVAQFTWAMIRLVLAGADIQQWVETIVMQLLVIGIFFWILTNSVAFGEAIVNSFRQAGNAATISAGGQANLSPGDVVNTGLNIGSVIISKLSMWEPAQSLAFAIAGIIIVLCFAWTAALLCYALVEAYGIVTMTMLFFGFTGASWTRDMGIAAVRAVFAAGVQIFVTTIIIGLAETMFIGWDKQPQITITDALFMVACSAVLVALVVMIPQRVSSLVSGSALNGNAAIGQTGRMIATGAAVTAGAVVGAGAAVAGATTLAAAQGAATTAVRAAAGLAARGSVARAGAFAGNAAKNLGAAAARDVGARLSGRRHHGNMGGRMAESLFDQAKAVRADAEKPVAPAAPSGPTSGPDNTIGPAR